MNKQEFLNALRSKLSAMKNEDIEKSLDFYQELIDDHMEDGMPEAAAVAIIGDVDTVANDILADYPLPALIKEKFKPKKKLETWQIALIILTAPIWFGLSIAAISIVFSLVIAAISLVVALAVAVVALPICAIIGIVAVSAGVGGIAILYSIGLFIMSLGASTLIALGITYLLKNIGGWTKTIIKKIKSSLTRRSNDHD